MYKSAPLLKHCVSNYLKRKLFYANAVIDPCPICQEQFHSSKEAVLISCGHMLCFECLLQGSTDLKTCPVCRA